MGLTVLSIKAGSARSRTEVRIRWSLLCKPWVKDLFNLLLKILIVRRFTWASSCARVSVRGGVLLPSTVESRANLSSIGRLSSPTSFFSSCFLFPSFPGNIEVSKKAGPQCQTCANRKRNPRRQKGDRSICLRGHRLVELFFSHTRGVLAAPHKAVVSLHVFQLEECQ